MIQEKVVFPPAGPDDYRTVMNQLTQMGLMRPTSAQIINLLDNAFGNLDNLYNKSIEIIFRNQYLWTCTECFTIPNEGVLIYDNIYGEDLEKEGLLKRFNLNDKTIRFVKFGFKIKYQSPSEFLSNSFVIQYFTESGMPALESVVKSLKQDAYVSALIETKEPEKRFSALLLDKERKGFALHGAGKGIGREGYAFGFIPYIS